MRTARKSDNKKFASGETARQGLGAGGEIDENCPSKAGTNIEPDKKNILFWRKWGYAEGKKKDGRIHSIQDAAYRKRALNTLWVKALGSTPISRMGWDGYLAAAKGYKEGFFKAARSVITTGCSFLPIEPWRQF